MSIEMIGKVASFANYGDDLMNICKAVGRKDSAVIRYTCLRKNYRYLHYSAARSVQGVVRNAKTGANVRAWMAINTDWKDDPVIGVETEDISKGTYNTVTVAKDGKRRSNCSPTVIFHNPAVAIELGLIEVLEYLVDKVGIDVNASVWNNYTHHERFHLLVHAVFQESSACFDYLMSSGKVDLNSLVEPGQIQTLKMFLMETDDIPKERFQAMVRLPSFDLNDPIVVAGRAIPPIIYMCLSATASPVPMSAAHLEKVQILLDEGADPARENLDGFPSPLSIAIGASSEDSGDSIEIRAGWKEVVRMMRKKIAVDEGNEE